MSPQPSSLKGSTPPRRSGILTRALKACAQVAGRLVGRIAKRITGCITRLARKAARPLALALALAAAATLTPAQAGLPNSSNFPELYDGYNLAANGLTYDGDFTHATIEADGLKPNYKIIWKDFFLAVLRWAIVGPFAYRWLLRKKKERKTEEYNPHRPYELPVWQCPTCKTGIFTSGRFCPNCGTAQPERPKPVTVLCPNCGKPLLPIPGKEKTGFCSECGRHYNIEQK